MVRIFFFLKQKNSKMLPKCGMLKYKKRKAIMNACVVRLPYREHAWEYRSWEEQIDEMFLLRLPVCDDVFLRLRQEKKPRVTFYDN